MTTKSPTIESNLHEKEERLRLATEAAEIGYWEWHVKSGTVHWDDQMFRIYGIEPTPDGNIDYHDWSSAVNPDELQQQEAILQETVCSKGHSKREFHIKRRNDGKTRTIQAVETVRKNNEGETEWVVGTNRDITETREAKKKLERQQKLLQEIANNYPNSYVSIIEKDLTVGFSSGQAFKKSGLDPKVYLGMSIDTIFGEQADFVKNNYLKTFSGEECNFELFVNDQYQLYRCVPLFSDDDSINQILVVVEDITDRVRIEESLRISQQRLLLHRNQSPVGIIEWNTNFEFIDWNPAAQKIFGFTKEEVAGSHITKKILPESARPAVDKVWEQLMANTGGSYSLNENLTKDGRTILCEWQNTPLIDKNGSVIGVTSLVEDVTERQQIEDNLAHTNKMEAIGKLTGGISHDFNNMLGVIIGFSTLIKNRLNNSDPKLIKYTDEILNAGERAKKLTSKLLEFSRNKPSDTEIVSINLVLRDMQHLLEKTLTASIDLKMSLEPNLWSSRLDKTRLEDAILNICINAMHAMPDGGTLKITTENIHLVDHDITDKNLSPGDYILISITDTGIGMDRQTKLKIFDPYFTTKGSEGTGLGMSQVYGFAQQSDGYIRAISEQGHGTRIAIYLPRCYESKNGTQNNPGEDSIAIPVGQETILIVDDEIALLDLATEILTTYGYTVLRAENAKKALEILNNQSIDLLLSDVIMPGMNGYQLAIEARKINPKLKIQMVSGFSEDKTVDPSNDSLHRHKIQKPYSSEELLLKIRALLDNE